MKTLLVKINATTELVFINKIDFRVSFKGSENNQWMENLLKINFEIV